MNDLSAPVRFEKTADAGVALLRTTAIHGDDYVSFLWGTILGARFSLRMLLPQATPIYDLHWHCAARRPSLALHEAGLVDFGTDRPKHGRERAWGRVALLSLLEESDPLAAEVFAARGAEVLLEAERELRPLASSLAPTIGYAHSRGLSEHFAKHRDGVAVHLEEQLTELLGSTGGTGGG